MRKALFLDRDGIINKDGNYLYKIEDIEFVEGIFTLLKTAQEQGYMLFVVTNQTGVCRGYYTEADVEKLHKWMSAEFDAEGIHIEKFYHCPHHPDYTGPCSCRKPEPGMILTAAQEYRIDLGKSVIIGDKNSDVEAGYNAGLGFKILMRSGYVSKPSPFADAVVSTLAEAESLLKKRV